VSMRRSLRTFALELATFAALAWYTAAHWASGLVADAPGGRVFACVVIAVAVGVVLTLADTAPRAQAWALRVGGILAGLGAGFVAIGLDAKYLAPAHWDELGDGLDRGFTALGSAQWPYGGAESWATLALLLAIPLVLTTAAAFAFWPSRSLRPFAVVLLVALFAFAVTEHRFEGELARGVGLLFFAAAWLWLPRMPDRGARTATAAAGAVLVACLAALPAAATYDDRDPLIDYQSWNPFAAHATTRFDWSHDYGPIDWPRDGTTLMYVKAAERNYWKLETLGAFVEDHWVRSGFGRGNNPILPEPYNVASETDLRVTIADLDTDVIPIAGTALQITGVDSGVLPTEDGTVEALEERPEEGDTYFVKAYVPDPTPLEMRAAPPDVPNALLEYTEVGHLAPAYDRVADLAARLARGEPTMYDVVRAVQEHLRTEYGYNERPPDRRYPLPAFLFRDRIGSDGCIVELADADGHLVPVAMANRDVDQVALMRELREQYPAEQDARRGVGHVFRTGDSELYAELDPAGLREGVPEDRQLEMLEALGVRSLMIVPMSTGGRRLGTIAFALSDSARRYDRADLSVAEELARRAAVAIDNARLYRERSYIARTLQESLLPPELPEVAGVEVAAKFHPAGEAFEVGGDFYDVFDTSHGWSVVMGDVCGKGADAAAVTALARYTLRTLGIQETSPAEVLRKLNDALLRQRADRRFCTVAYASLQVNGGGSAEVCLSSGGHPLPYVLRADGRVETVGEPGTLLGVLPDVRLSDTSVRLGRGDVMVLYTDGVTEARGPDGMFGADRLASVLASCAGLDAKSVAARIESAALEIQEGHPRDDIAILAVRIR
jgi:serine phosphatase RsbU (regulator of sigma subunit)